MALHGSGRSRRPSACPHTKGYGRADLLDGRPNPGKISGGASPHNAPAIWTAPAAEHDLFHKTIEQNPFKSVTPDSITLAPRTGTRPGPWEFSAHLHNHLDGDEKGQYHRNTFVGASRPVHTRAVARASYRPFL